LSFNPQNILVVNFGQLGDVVLSLPALRAVRERFPDAKITALVGKASAEIIEITDFVDEKIAVDRVKLRDSAKIWSIKEILKLIKEIRLKKFDFIIDLHSLYETNLLGFVSGAKHRLYINRENRSLDFLANFQPRPPLEDKKLHLTDHYLNFLKPLGVENRQRFVQIQPSESDIETVEKILQTAGSKQLVGMFPGAGHPSRRWSLDKFADLAGKFSTDKSLRTIVFLGPEETDLRREVEEKFPVETLIIDKLTLPQFAAALSRLRVLISNDTGAMHLGAIVGTAIVLILDKNAPSTYLPLTEKIHVVKTRTLDKISVEEVLQAAQSFLKNSSAISDEIKQI
jgi:ADP-heptose:LPS heptosyltransferase